SAQGWDDYESALAAQPTTPVDAQAEGADMLYSSGTTGRPQGVKPPLPATPFPTQSAVGALSAMLFGADEHTVYLSPAPLYHAAPLRFSMANHRLGGTVVAMEHFDPERFLEL